MFKNISGKLSCLLFQSIWRTRLFLFLSGAIYPLSFAPFEIWPLAFVSIIPLVIALLKKRLLSAFKLGFYWGLGCFSVGASWVYVSIHEFGFVPWFGALPLTLLFVAYLAIFKGLFGYLTQLVLFKTKPLMLIFIAPLFWLLSEYLQSVVFSGFPWLLAGYSQIDSPLAGLASWFGVYGVSWFVLVFSAVLGLIFVTSNKLTLSLILMILSSLVFLSSLEVELAFTETDLTETVLTKTDDIAPPKNSSIDVALIQPNISQHHKWDRRYFDEIIGVLEKESKPYWGADLVIWPEGAIPAYSNQVTDILAHFKQLAINNNSHLILGIPEYEPENNLSFVALQSYGKQSQNYRKQVLVPFGEYVPLESWLRGVISFLDLPMSGFSLPITTQKPMSFEKMSVIPAICYEIVYPTIIRDLSLQAEKLLKNQLIVTVSNDAWFGDSLGPYQHMQMARMRALELGIPLVRSTNDGITAIVNNKGKITHQLPRYLQTGLHASVELDNIKTVYRRWGFLGLSIILLLSMLFIGSSFIRK